MKDLFVPVLKVLRSYTYLKGQPDILKKLQKFLPGVKYPSNYDCIDYIRLFD